MVIIKAFNFAKIISNIVIYYHNFSDLLITIEALFDIKFVFIVFQAWLLPIEALFISSKLVITILFFVHQILDAAILLYSIYKSAALSKSQIATSKAYL